MRGLGWHAHSMAHAAAAALLRLTLVLAVLSPALAVLAAGDEGAVRQEGKPCVVDRTEDVVVGDRRLAGDPAV